MIKGVNIIDIAFGEGKVEIKGEFICGRTARESEPYPFKARLAFEIHEASGVPFVVRVPLNDSTKSDFTFHFIPTRPREWPGDIDARRTAEDAFYLLLDHMFPMLHAQWLATKSAA